KGIKKGCDESGCVLLGGETAEMPGFYKGDDYDLAGFVTGAVDRKDVIDGSKIRPKDRIIGIPSSGPHSNGYSLIRKVLSEKEIVKHGKQLLAPTRIYVKTVLRLLKKHGRMIHGLCHITGGGFYDNIERLLPGNCAAVIRKGSWAVPDIFRVIQKKGNIPEKEMYRTLNMGIGMVVITDRSAAAEVQKALPGSSFIGEIGKGAGKVEIY
ncbi:MAG: phosphoribosylformylglycinamidine cyclo-ligase, partial [bacterium]|nr:phosphoribosylformylglycinamidine cyclo-ligase [bacterium]